MARTLMCGRGGIGRRAALRSLWGKTRGSSSLLGRTNYLPFISLKPLKYNNKLYFNADLCSAHSCFGVPNGVSFSVSK